MATRTRKWWWLASAALVLGAYVECYARSLADLIMVECPNLRLDAPGHCAHPLWLALAGALLIGSGLLGLAWLTIRAFIQRQ